MFEILPVFLLLYSASDYFKRCNYEALSAYVQYLFGSVSVFLSTVETLYYISLTIIVYTHKL